jgi:cell fate (sporulation/competence/biofilm development) regulator YlbF (YheA/YmcA/DUF963 family)
MFPTVTTAHDAMCSFFCDQTLKYVIHLIRDHHMQLKDLFEAIGELQPGEKRTPDNIQLRDLQAVARRIEELKDAIDKSDDLMKLFKQDQALQAQLNQLQDRIVRRVEILHKVKARPTAGMARMWHILETECSEFIPAMQQAGKLLYRGTRDHVHQYEGRSREDRQVKDSNQEISRKFDETLMALGVKALRSNSIYTTSSYGFASSYGYNVYMIFPKNGFNFLSTNKRDLILEKWSQLMDQDKLKELWLELDAWGQANVPNWSTTNIGRVLRYKEYEYVYGRVKENFDWDGNRLNLPEKFNIDEKEWITPEGVAKEFDPNTTNIIDPIKSGHEILINGEYWALEKRSWEQAVRERYLPSTSPDNDY